MNATNHAIVQTLVCLCLCCSYLFCSLSVLAQGLSLSLCLLLLDSDYFWVNDNPFKRCALIIMLEEDELSRVACVIGFPSISNSITHEKTVSYYWSIAWIGTIGPPWSHSQGVFLKLIEAPCYHQHAIPFRNIDTWPPYGPLLSTVGRDT